MKNTVLPVLDGAKRVVASALALMALMAAPAAWAQSTLEKVKSRGMLVVGYREDATPFSMTDGKTPAGYSIDLCAPIIERIGQASGAKDLRVVFQVEGSRIVRMAWFEPVMAGAIQTSFQAGGITRDLMRARVSVSLTGDLSGF